MVTVNLVPAEAGGRLGRSQARLGRPAAARASRSGCWTPTAKQVEVGDLGLLEVRGANLFTGYWPDGAGGPDEDGWFATGDLAVADDDGDYYLVGRRSDLVLVNGFNVYPAEVEAVFGRLAGVREVAVLGVPDAARQRRDRGLRGARARRACWTRTTLLEQAGRSLARFKLPRQVIEVDALPHTATGKVMKWRLRNAIGGQLTADAAGTRSP